MERYSSAKLSVFSKILLVSLAVGVLLIPIYLLFLVTMTRLDMALTVSAFMLLFCVVMCSTTDAKAQEVLIGTAGYVLKPSEYLLRVVKADLIRYGAVLATFLGNLNSNQGCGCGNTAE